MVLTGSVSNKQFKKFSRSFRFWVFYLLFLEKLTNFWITYTTKSEKQAKHDVMEPLVMIFSYELGCFYENFRNFGQQHTLKKFDLLFDSLV